MHFIAFSGSYEMMTVYITGKKKYEIEHFMNLKNLGINVSG